MPNPSIQNAWSDLITHNSPDFVAHLAYAETTINSLTCLTTAEIQGNDGSLSVLGDSDVTWGGKLTDKQKKEITANSDVSGFAYGWREAGQHW